MSRRERGFLFSLIVAMGVVCALDPALADTSSTASSAVFTSVQAKASDIFTNVRNILMIIGAIGVLALATMAFFGKFKWSWAVSLLSGLALIAFVGQVVQYFVGTSANIPVN
ncbi:TrbC/VirB2 family protein [Telmatospirillum siberiense]|nr:TrbC/VirB2 family protein [Telmatospirillum siberiense]